MDGPWTLSELTTKAAAALADGRSPRPSGRGRDLPNERTIRWYVTIGLVDPPLSRRGRVAVYGPRHLLQLVAIKRRQSEGHSLADIQAELTGATDATLHRIARLDPTADHPADSRAAASTSAPRTPIPGSGPPAPNPGAQPPEHAGEPSIRKSDVRPPTPGARRFWAERPASPAGPPAPAPAHPSGPPIPEPASPAGPPASESVSPAGPPGPESAPGVLVRGVRLAPGVTLLLDSSPFPEDAAAIAAAAAPLLDLLTERGLL
ncbi:MerR family transcriptional regulator [Actinoallomurus sp. NPDC052308]|uniref:MerR family transcriptional regulator n=1 Tax=Actinoallomurus sp. NPDC052308 TaxID=3155530 RepID=UPI003424BBAF